ncbi:MAG: molybdopterin-dependent oxidoreductase, partial [Candidatus Eisenbacteria bacterium]|nr:molybdopterin-dependent oxidoreductase [Candidatus Eisenbacteria bacterium]
MIKESLCPLDCPDGCSLEVELEKGRVTRIGGSHRNKVTQGFICAKVRRFPEMLYGKDRVDRPHLRQGPKGSGEYAPISWDEALDRITESFQTSIKTHGAQSILPLSYGGSNGFLSQDTTDARLFRRLGASRLARTVCAAPTGAVTGGMYGKMPGVAYPDYEAANLIVVWGANPNATGIHLLPYIKNARDKGAKLLVVDPRETPLAKLADLHLPVIPGTDVVLALSMIRWLYSSGKADLEFLKRHALHSEELQKRAEPWTFERAGEISGCDPKQIEEFVRLYADASPAVLRCGWGLERNRNGGSAVAAVLALPAVAGKFGLRGGGYTMSNSGAWGVDTDAAVAEPETRAREINMNKIGEV